MLAALFFLALLAGGVAASRALWRRGGDAGDPPGPFESAASAALLALGLAVALAWSLAIAHLFTRAALVVAAVATAAVASRSWGPVRLPPAPRAPRVVAIALAPCALWLAYSFV